MIINLIFKILSLLGFFSSGIDPSLLVEIPIPNQDFVLTASKAAVFSEELNSFVFAKEIDKPQAIASITKLMSAIVFLEADLDLNSTYNIKAEDKVGGGKINLFLGDEVSLKDLLYTSLIASDNGATIALAGAMGLSQEEFVKKMNAKASEMSLLNTKFLDPSGLNPNNVSTPREIIKIFLEALKHKEIKEAILLAKYSYLTSQGREKSIESTDSYLLTNNSKEIRSLGGKTGYIDEAGYCFVGKFADKKGGVFYVVVLNSEDKNSRFLESKSLADFFRNKYEQNQ